MSLFYWLLLIAAISLTESIITSTGRSQQISNVPHNTTTHTTNENQEETSLQLPRVKRQTVETLKKFINITQAIPVKTVYIPVRMHQFNKMIPFQQVYSQITNLKLTLRNLDPTSNTRTEEIQGKDVNYVKSSYPRSMNQNSLQCAERGGYVASITQIVKDRLDTRTPTATRDEISISNKILTCMFTEVNKRGLSCIEYLVNIASTLGLEFYRGTPPQILMEIVTLFPQTVIHPVLDSNMITLQEDPRTIVYCTVPKQAANQRPDELTRIIQKKFYNHQSTLFSAILESYEKILENQEHLYALLLITRIPSKTSNKTFADQCKAIKRLIPVNIPSQITTTSYLSTTFLQTTKENSLKTTAIFTALTNHINTLCTLPSNEPVINQMFQALQLLTLNVQALIQAQIAHSANQNQTLTFQAPLTLLVTATTKTADIDQLFYNIFQMRLTPAELSYIYTMIENEKTKTLLWLKNLLPPNLQYPEILRTSQIIEKSVTQDQIVKTYRNHPELLQPGTANTHARTNIKKQYTPLREEEITNNNIQNDQPQLQQTQQPYQQQPTQPPQELHPWDEAIQARNSYLNDSQASIPEETGATTQTNNQQQLSTQTTQPNSIPTTTTEQPTINFLELLNRPTNPPHTQVLSRKKRHWLSQAFSDLTGLATQTDLNILNANEEKMRLEEEKTQKELKTIETKTQNIIQIIDEQAVKMAKLYSDEAEVKQAIKIVLKEEQDVIMQIAQLTASMEIQSDISIEYAAFANALSLIPHMLHEIEESLLAVTNQAIYPSLLPAESILRTIPFYSKQSILSATVSAIISSKMNTIEISVPEFINPFTVYYVKTIPIAHNTTNRIYTTLKLENKYVAVDPAGSTFLYKPETCATKNTITTCNPAMLEIHKEAQTCIEALMSPSQIGAGKCIQSMKVEKVDQQSYIYKTENTVIRIFSPFPDTVSTLCGHTLNQNAGTLKEGYTDLSFKSDCVLYTSQMVIYSPYKPTIEETIKPLLSTPDLSMEIESLLSDIHEVHRINLTTLGQEFQTLDIDIQNELMDLSNVNEVLQKAANIKEITIFDPTDIKLEKISESNTALKIVTWAVAILAFGFIIFCIVSCCPVQIFAMLKATFKAILALLTCTCTTAFMTTSSITRFMRRRQNLHASPATNSDLNESSDQPGATITYMPHSTYRRRLFPNEEDSDDELTVFSAQRTRQQQQQRQDYREVQRQLDQRRSQSFETTNFTTSPPPYNKDPKNEMYPNVPSAPTMTSPATLQLGRSKPHNAELQESSWEIINVNNLGAKLTRQKSTPALYFHGRTNKVYTLEGTEIPIERPPRNLIIEYQETLLTLPQFSLEQMRLILTNDTIEYDKNLKAYYTPVINSSKRFYHFAYRCLPQPDQ